MCTSCTVPMTHWGHRRRCFSDTRLSWEESASVCCRPWIHIWATEIWSLQPSLNLPHAGRGIRNEEAPRITPDYFLLIRRSDYGFHQCLRGEMSKLWNNLHVEMEPARPISVQMRCRTKAAKKSLHSEEEKFRKLRKKVKEIKCPRAVCVKSICPPCASERSRISTSGAGRRVWPRVNFFLI